MLHEFGYISSYDEVLRYRKSAAKMNARLQWFAELNRNQCLV